MLSLASLCLAAGGNTRSEVSETTSGLVDTYMESWTRHAPRHRRVSSSLV